MPRVTLAHTVNDVPVTVAAAADLVGVSPSTLRTWDRRYGLSPSARTVGAHRRYTALDIARLERMCELIHNGVSACDAAHIVTTESIDELGVDYDVTSLQPTDLVNAAFKGDELVIRSMLDKAIADIGLVHTWQDLIRPALQATRSGMDVKSPGFCPTVTLEALTLQAIEQLVKKAPKDRDPDGPRILVAGDHSHVIEVNVIGAALAWHCKNVRALCTNGDLVDDAVVRQIGAKHPAVVVFVDHNVDVDTIDKAVAADVDVFLSGDNTPDVHGDRITRLRSASATVDEIISVLHLD